jgi:predicted ATPase
VYSIGFTGAGGTGKTTTAVAVADQLGVVRMGSAARAIYEKRSLTEATVLEMRPVEQWQLQKDIFYKKVEQDDLAENYVADRTILDHWAYCLLYCASHVEARDFRLMEKLVQKHMRFTYSHIFYFPTGYFEPESDGVRNDSKAWQGAIDGLIIGYLHKWKIPFTTADQTNGAVKRAEFVVGKIQTDIVVPNGEIQTIGGLG